VKVENAATTSSLRSGYDIDVVFTSVVLLVDEPGAALVVSKEARGKGREGGEGVYVRRKSKSLPRSCSWRCCTESSPLWRWLFVGDVGCESLAEVYLVWWNLVWYERMKKELQWMTERDRAYIPYLLPLCSWLVLVWPRAWYATFHRLRAA